MVALRLTWADLEIPAVREGLRVTWADLEVPNPGSVLALRLTWADLEIPIQAAAVVIPRMGIAVSMPQAVVPGLAIAVSGAGPLPIAVAGLVPRVTTGTGQVFPADILVQALVPSVRGVSGTIDGLRLTWADLEAPNVVAKVAPLPMQITALMLTPVGDGGVGVTGAGPMAITVAAVPPIVHDGGVAVLAVTVAVSAPPPAVTGGAKVTVPVMPVTVTALVPAVSGNVSGVSGAVNVVAATVNVSMLPPAFVITQSDNAPGAGDKTLTINLPGTSITIVED